MAVEPEQNDNDKAIIVKIWLEFTQGFQGEVSNQELGELIRKWLKEELDLDCSEDGIRCQLDKDNSRRVLFGFVKIDIEHFDAIFQNLQSKKFISITKGTTIVNVLNVEKIEIAEEDYDKEFTC
ncbi:TPA: hypothetical protein U1C92_000094 [Streptococcus suis]|nr:hypothetical protein [Streptococcus suis]HEM3684839.1 hypothetical protein [Streptococcus suis]HEM3692464.1 hypothetical protein [Streptococcus suis]